LRPWNDEKLKTLIGICEDEELAYASIFISYHLNKCSLHQTEIHNAEIKEGIVESQW
jgi:hypothetical protein